MTNAKKCFIIQTVIYICKQYNLQTHVDNRKEQKKGIMGVSKTESIIIGAILEAMQRKRVTRKELAKVLGIQRTTLSTKFTHGRFTAKEIFEMCDYLNIQFVTLGEAQ